MPIPLVVDQPEEESYVGLANRLPITTMEAVKTTFQDELFNNAATAKITNYFAKKEMEQLPGKELSVEELNQKYDGLGLTWDGPKREAVAEFIADKQRDRLYTQKKLESGPDDYMTEGLKFGAAVAAHIADPTELGLTVATAGVFRLGAAAAFGAKAIQGAGLGAKVALGVGEGAVSQIALEPLEFMYDKEFQRDYQAIDAFKRVAYGAAMGGLLEGGVHSGQKLIQKMRKTKAHAVSHDAALGQFAEGRPVDVEPIVEAYNAERVGLKNPEIPDYSGRTQYQFQPFDPASPAGRKIYLGSQSALEDFKILDLTAHGPEGFVDNPLIANADAASAFNETVGMVHEITLSPEARIISTSQAVGANERVLLTQAIKEAFKDLPSGKTIIDGLEKGRLEFTSLNDIVSAANSLGISDSAVFKALEPKLEAVGFHGLHIEDAVSNANRFEFFTNAIRNNGTEGARLFDSVSPFAGDERLVQGLSPEKVAELRAKQANPEMAIDKEIDAFSTEALEKADAYLNDPIKVIDEEIALFNEKLAPYKDDPEFKDFFDELERFDADYKKVEKDQDFIMKAAMDCVVKYG
jgi:hypothetical protein